MKYRKMNGSSFVVSSLKLESICEFEVNAVVLASASLMSFNDWQLFPATVSLMHLHLFTASSHCELV